MISKKQWSAHWLVHLGLCLLGLTGGGCYDGKALVAKAEAKASHTLLEEVDLGKYSVTLPRSLKASTTVALELHVFANVAKRDVLKIEDALEEKKYLLRHRTIMKLRQAVPDDLADPGLTNLRNSVMNVTKETLSDAPIESICFYRFGIIEQ